MIEISIIIPTFNRAESLRLTLESIVRQDYDKNKYNIYVVDNASTDHTSLVVQEFCSKHTEYNLKYLTEPVPGTLAARHCGSLKSNGDILVFTDDDVDFDNGWLSSIVKAFNDPVVQIVGGKSLPKYETEPPNWLNIFWHNTPYEGKMCGYLSLIDLGDTRLHIDANYIWSLNLAIRRKALFDLGGFNPGIVPKHMQKFQGDEEGGLTIKANKNKYKSIYDPKALVYHRIPAYRFTPEYFEERAYYQGICDSFTAIRYNGGLNSGELKNNHLIAHIKYPYQYIYRLSKKLLNNIGYDNISKQIKKRADRAYIDGYYFHQNAVKDNDRLLEWVLRKDYWDYRFPKI